MSKREIIVLIFYAVAAIWGLRSPIAACCLFTINNTFRPLHWARATGFLNPAVFPDNHFVTAILVLSLFLRPWQKRWHAGCAAMLVLCGWVWLSYGLAEHRDIAYRDTYAATTYLLPLVLVGLVISDRRSQQIYLYALALGLGIHLAWAGFHGILTGQPQLSMGIRGGQLGGRNNFTVAGSACFPLLVYVAFHYLGPWQRWMRLAALGMIPLSFAAFFYSASRGAVLGIGALVIWYIVSSGRAQTKIVVAVLLLLVVLPLIPDFVWERVSTIQLGLDQVEGSAVERLRAMELGWQITLEHPVFGVGPDNSWVLIGQRGLRSGSGVETHSIWLKCSSEYGLPMLVAFVVLMGSLMLRLNKVGKRAREAGDGETNAFATALSCALFAFLATGTFTSQFLSEYLWSLVLLSMAFLSTVRETAPEHAPAWADVPSDPEPLTTRPGPPSPERSRRFGST